jgi:hypothetical protein
LKVDEGAFNFNVPMSYFPKFKKSDEPKEEDEPEILFNFSAKLRSLHNFKQVCHPQGFDVIENS